MSVSGIARMNLASMSDDDLARLHGAMQIGLIVDDDPERAVAAAEIIEAIDDEFSIRSLR